MIIVKTPVIKLIQDLTNLTGDERSRAKMHNGDVLNQSQGGVITKNFVNDAEAYFTVEDMRDAMNEGGEVFEFAPMIQIITADLGSIIPEGLPNRMTKPVLSEPDENGDQTIITPARPKTWQEWVVPNHTITQIETNSYFSSVAGGKAGMVNGEYKVGLALTGTELMIIDANLETTLLTKAEFNALLPKEEGMV